MTLTSASYVTNGWKKNVQIPIVTSVLPDQKSPVKMDIEYRKSGRRWIAEVWSDDQSEPLVAEGFKEPYPEDTYREINQWCYTTFGYQPRTAYHVFEFRKKSDLNWFLLRWT